MKVIRRLSSLIVLFSFSGFVAAVNAQTTNGSINGTVTDPSGGAIGGVQVQATNQGTGEQRSASTQDNGAYVIPQLPPGQYTVSVDKQGFAKETRPNVQLLVNQSATLDFKLSVADGRGHRRAAAAKHDKRDAPGRCSTSADRRLTS